MEYALRVGGFEDHRQAWEQILPASPNSSIFVTPWWQEAWYQHFGDGADLRIVSVRAGDQVIGIAPLMLSAGTISFLGDTDLFDYHEFVAVEEHEEGFYDTLWEYIMRLEWDTLELRSVQEDSSILKRLPALAAKEGLALQVTDEDMAPITSLPASWDEYVGGLAKKSRHELRRKLRRLESADNYRQYVLSDPESIPEHMPDFFRLLRASSEDKNEFLTPEREAFFVDIGAQLASRGQFKLYFLEVGGVRVASCICFDYAGSYLLYNSGYDPEFSQLSVGLLNKALCIRDAIQEGRSCFEFLRGTERYKYDLGATDRALYRISAQR